LGIGGIGGTLSVLEHVTLKIIIKILIIYISGLLEKQSLGNKLLVSEQFALWSESKWVIKLCNLVGGVIVCIGILGLISK
jgi:hypothetical protein